MESLKDKVIKLLDELKEKTLQNIRLQAQVEIMKNTLESTDSEIARIALKACKEINNEE